MSVHPLLPCARPSKYQQRDLHLRVGDIKHSFYNRRHLEREQICYKQKDHKNDCKFQTCNIEY